MKVALHPLGVDGERFAGLESPTEGRVRGVLLCFPGFWAACAWVGGVGVSELWAVRVK